MRKGLIMLLPQHRTPVSPYSGNQIQHNSPLTGQGPRIAKEGRKDKYRRSLNVWLTTGRPQGPEKKGGVIEADRDRVVLWEREPPCLPAIVYSRCLDKVNTGSILALLTSQSQWLKNNVLRAWPRI